MNLAYVGLGSNLDEPLQQLHKAVKALRKLSDTRLEKTSAVYRSSALGPGTQPDYLNAAVRLRTSLNAPALLAALQAIEQSQGRVRDVRWGARTLDLDLLLYANERHSTPELTIPHPRMQERDFVLRPLLDVVEESQLLPIDADLATLLGQCASSGLEETHHTL